jgi:hypothetical protein
MKQTAVEFLRGKPFSIESIHSNMIQFAKLHVEAALKSASKNAYVEYIDLNTNEIFDYTDVITDDNVGADVNKKSILNAYPLEKIK